MLDIRANEMDLDVWARVVLGCILVMLITCAIGYGIYKHQQVKKVNLFDDLYVIDSMWGKRGDISLEDEMLAG